MVEEVSSDGLVSYMAMPASGSGNAADVPVRSDYSTTLAFEPFLRSGDSGRLEFKVRNSDKLSTFVVQVWAHDRLMKNNVVRKEMLVSIPVKVSVVEPKSLCKGVRFPTIQVSRSPEPRPSRHSPRGTIARQVRSSQGPWN